MPMLNLSDGEFGSLVALGIDILISYGLYKVYKSSCRVAEEIKKVDKIELDDLHHLVKSSDNGTLPYVCVGGVTQAVGPAIKSRFVDSEGVVQTVTLTEHKSKRYSPNVWSDSTHKIRNNTESVPFCLTKGEAQCHVAEPMTASNLMNELSTTYDKFEQNQSNLLKHGLDLVAGEVSKGFQEVEKMLLVGTQLLGIGEVTLESGRITLRPPSNGSKYILTKQSLSEVVRSYEQQSVFVRIVLKFCVAIGTGLAAFLLFRAFKKIKSWWMRHRMRNEVHAARQQLARQQANARREGGDDNTDDANMCVVCLTNPREVVLLNCGHICLCIDCVDMLPTPMMCPVCRQSVERYVLVFNP